ncbi:MAG: hypothetical protein K1X94_20600 [Sandaracinaceae bacterium]|nr:hypothetical protein [Sandaracinaceae bacterium]
MPLEPVGGSCTSDYDCESRNCSQFAGVCRVPHGAPCTVDDCDECLAWSDGTSYCTGRCDALTDCGNGWCSGAYGDIPFRRCYPDCDGRSCDCRTTSDGRSSYCACPASDCGREEARHAPLAPCDSWRDEGGDCATGSCVGRTVCGASCYTWGYCGDACSSDADCGASGACAQFPCSSATCPAVCVPRCDGAGRCAGDGRCLAVPGLTGEVMACTTKLMVGENCYEDGDCISGRCTSGRCS